MTIKLKIDLSQGQIEVEGSDDIVKEIYNDFMGKISTITPQVVQLPVEKTAPQLEVIGSDDKKESAAGKKKTTPKRSSSTPNFKMITELSGGQDAQKLKDFHGKYSLKGQAQRVTLFVYFLEKQLNVSNISADHLYTCYKIVGQPLPKVLQQAVRDAKSQKNWLIHDDWNDLKITHMGENAVEHEFEKAQNAA